MSSPLSRINISIKTLNNNFDFEHANIEHISNDLIVQDSTLKLFSNIETQISSIITAVFDLGLKWNGPKAMLLHGVEGSGKSFILNHYFQSISNYSKIKISTDDFEDNEVIEKLDDLDNERFMNILLILYRAKLSKDILYSQTIQFDSSLKILWIIDDLDRILQSTIDSKEPTINDSNNMSLSKSSYCIKRLIDIIKISSNMLLIGSTRMNQRDMGIKSTKFDHHIIISKPNVDDRSQLLQKLFHNHVLLDEFNNNSEINTNTNSILCLRLASLTGGYLPGDIISLYNKIVNLQKGTNLLNKSTIKNINENENIIYWNIILKGLSFILPKQLQNLDGLFGTELISNNTKNHLNWNNFCGYNEIKFNIRKLLNRLNETHSMKTVSKTNGILIYGPSGCGKSYLASIIATEAKMNFVSIKSTEILSKYFGQTENSIRNLFSKARAASPCVLFFDEFDAIACKRYELIVTLLILLFRY